MNPVCYSIILNTVGNDFKSFLFTFMHIIKEIKPDVKENSDKLKQGVTSCTFIAQRSTTTEDFKLVIFITQKNLHIVSLIA